MNEALLKSEDEASMPKLMPHLMPSPSRELGTSNPASDVGSWLTQTPGNMLLPGAEESRSQQLLALQETVGNQAVQRLVARETAGSSQPEKQAAKTTQSEPTRPEAAQEKGTQVNAGPAAAAPEEAKKQEPLKLSDEGLKFIARFEGFEPKLYDDVAKNCTIGYGHLVHMGPINGKESEEFKGGITEERGQELLREDAESAIQVISQKVKVTLTQTQFDALVSFVYNVGAGAFESSTLLKELNAGHVDKIADEIKKWSKAAGKVVKGLQVRREAEAKLFTEGTY